MAVAQVGLHRPERERRLQGPAAGRHLGLRALSRGRQRRPIAAIPPSRALILLRLMYGRWPD